MGMFDTVVSSYDLGERFTHTRCQTKDIDNTMSEYWISPAGQLYLIDYSYTADFVELKEGDDGYNDKISLFNFQWVPNGTHGKVSPFYLTKYITIYPERRDDAIRLHFRYGILQDYYVIS